MRSGLAEEMQSRCNQTFDLNIACVGAMSSIEFQGFDKGRTAKGDRVNLRDHDARARRRRVRRQQCIIDRYYLRGQISRRQFRAGERLYRLYSASGAVSPSQNDCHWGRFSRGLSPYQPLSPGPLKEIFEAVGTRLSSVLIHVCLYDEAAGHWGARHRGKAEDGIAVLRLALDSLADYWGLPV